MIQALYIIRCMFYSYPAIYCMMLSAVDAIKDLGLKEQCKFAGQTGEIGRTKINQYVFVIVFLLGGLLYRDIPNFEEMRGVRIDDYSMFTSPWAISIEDEEIFNETTKELGKLLGADLKLWVVYLMLLITSQPSTSPITRDKQLQQVQMEFRQLLYRYLSSTLGSEEAARHAHSLIGLLNKLHRCGDIFMNKRIKMLQ